MRLAFILPAALAAALLSACASPEVVQVSEIGDNGLTCDQLEREMAEADSFERRARDERGVTGKNVAAAMLFWPALLATYSNTEDAISAAQERQRTLARLADEKNC